MEIKTLDGSQPHASYGGWRGFLDTCEHRRHEYGVIFYGKTNCNYILFPCGLVFENFGYHGTALMNRIAEEGADAVLESINRGHAEIKALLSQLQEGS